MSVLLTVLMVGSSIFVFSLEVRAGSQLYINETHSPAPILVSETVTFTLTAGGTVPPYHFSWSLGDGTTGTGSTLSHVYTASGQYYTRFNVTDSASPSNSAYTAGYYLVQNPPPETASISYSPQNLVAGQTVTFTASVTGGTSPYSFSWSFGDCQTDCSPGSGQTVTHTYLAGKYNVTLSITDSVASNAPFFTFKSITVPSQAPDPPAGGGGGGSPPRRL